jgi:hypothetical protein
MFMKKMICLMAGLLVLAQAFGQSIGGPVKGNIRPVRAADSPEPSSLTRFNLDFGGGTPEELAKAIEKAMGKPLNVIINGEDADIKLPPLKMSDVTVVELFHALEQASVKQVAVKTGTYTGSQSSTWTTYSSGYGFKPNFDGPATDTSIWYFHVNKPALPPLVSNDKVAQFYSLEMYLNRGLTVDDITTAIQTGWKMAGIKPAPELNYHKETKMLIAYGDPDKLETIGKVLNTLPSSNTTSDEMRYYKGEVDRQIAGLKVQIAELKKKVPAADSADEKSGK